jgi:hypothetical protein
VSFVDSLELLVALSAKLSKQEKRTASSTCETWTVAAAAGVRLAHVR